MPDPRLKTSAPEAVRHLTSAGELLSARQKTSGPRRGSVPPWPGAEEPDFHATAAAIWIWARQAQLGGSGRFDGERDAGWDFLDRTARRFIPDAIDADSEDEAPYDCALALVAAAAEHALGAADERAEAIAERAARVLAIHLGTIEHAAGREFRDPGLLALALVGYARAIGDRGLLASGRKFIERAFGMKAPAPFANEPAADGGLFDFSSTTATRILAVMAAEGSTPFVGAWLRERVAAAAPRGFIPRRLDENAWNACAAWALGRAYVVSTDPTFLRAYSSIMDELDRRDGDRDGGIGRDQTVRAAEVTPTFYYALAVDALVTPERVASAPDQAGAVGGG